MERQSRSRTARLTLATLGVLAAAWLLPPAVHRAMRLCPVRPDGVNEARAVPQFARRYGIDCSVCHTAVPQLTEVGYKFRAAGFRMPDEIGNDAKFAGWQDVTSVRLREQYKITAAATDKSGNRVAPTNGFVNGGLDWWPIMGAFSKYWAMGSEVDFNSAGAVTFNNGYMKGTFPVNDDLFVTVRAGLMAALEGYGGSDRNIGSLSSGWKATPAQGSIVVSGKQQAAFTGRPVGSNGEGLEGGVSYKDTRVTVQVTNGYNSGTNSTQQGEDNNIKDWAITANQFIGERINLNALYTNNHAVYAYANSGANSGAFGLAENTAGATNWADDYWRSEFFANFKALNDDKLNFLFGVQRGQDHLLNVTTGNGSDSFTSWGWMATAQSELAENLMGGVTYGTALPSTRSSADRVSDVTFSLNKRWGNCRVVADYQVRRTQYGAGSPNGSAGHDRTDNTWVLDWDLHF